jgi:predicted NACHT family NTPase
LHQGAAFILLDGLDEVHPSKKGSVLHHVRRFVTQFHSNYFVMSCRTAAQDYLFEQFTEMEIADFSVSQIANFIIRWFDQAPLLGFQLIQSLENNPPILELATTPILLTLICLVFEELEALPPTRTALCCEAANILLKEWDAKRYIDRGSGDESLTLQQKEQLMSHIALLTFERGDYFFEQAELEQWIHDYMRHVLENPQPDSETILRSIEAQHGLLVERARGIYSFSHLIFHEYFAACAAAKPDGPDRLETNLQSLAEHIIDPRWEEVILLTLDLLPNPEHLLQLIKQQLEQIEARNPAMLELLTLLNNLGTIDLETIREAIRTVYLEQLD